MSQAPEPLCFTCGLPVGDPLRLNHLASGQVCPSCRDRLLDALPAPFPMRPAPAPAGEPEDDDDQRQPWEEPPSNLVYLHRPRGPENEPA
jgi:hypothetical protein